MSVRQTSKSSESPKATAAQKRQAGTKGVDLGLQSARSIGRDVPAQGFYFRDVVHGFDDYDYDHDFGSRISAVLMKNQNATADDSKFRRAVFAVVSVFK
ncbi:hypothetical protein OCU04_007560 [Sclerotinia nivalis]|uniref:Uncharacterized protein n=1 Tax=Sclerotinia nivalis TaxID=352851 RepID=A0A9X0AJ16_9HELO|nr:hypothetical protein OCU04_007560 [Sclerotinia nivalis]